MSNELIRKTDVLDLLNDFYSDFEEYSRLFDDIDFMNPVNAVEPKTGHWIEDAKTYYGELKKRSLGVDEYTPYFTDDIACSECLAKYSVLDNETQFFKYCPNCGARMEEI
jgi:hypothetical protein